MPVSGRKHKHLCVIPIKGQPCDGCRARTRDCTFDLPPLDRGHRKRRATQPAAIDDSAHAADNHEVDVRTIQANVDIASGSLITSAARDAHLGNEQTGDMNLVLGPICNTDGLDMDMLIQTQDPEPLDLEGGEDQESHFVGSEALAGMALRNHLAELTGPVSDTFRRVSTDPQLPVYFIKQQSYLYGKPPSIGQDAFQAVIGACDVDGGDEDVLAKSLSVLESITLPAMPFIDPKRIDLACREPSQGGPIPFALLAGIIAHSTMYLESTRTLTKILWSHVLVGLDAEYRQPRLQTLQLAILLLSSRPSENVGQREIGLARAVGAANLLGLHVDSTSWRLPLWERRLRKRIWWTLLIHDKWRALLFGRPCYRILEHFYSVQAMVDKRSDLQKIGVLEQVIGELSLFEASLPATVQWNANASSFPGRSLPTGALSLAVSYYGLTMIVHRLLLEAITDRLPLQAKAAMQGGLVKCGQLINTMETISPTDRQLFWMPYSSNHVSNCASLLLMIASRASMLDPEVASLATMEIDRLATSLISHYTASHWDVAESALRRLSVLLLSARVEIPAIGTSYQRVNECLGIPVVVSSDVLLSLMGISELDLFAWTDPSQTWMGTQFTNPAQNGAHAAAGPSSYM
ncbi:hypothetical protein I316_06271 [Kwoniella heveanensis BCC8398]|uniref:Xylanolytic transcriptional activator regulatory domain-containing protein n=1 Tax=Kwoniella heveanensis BCC8398 TaxID=1296120 RepID=A0A1B9GMP5_9TREE|nr:hypothetical protein I316_06271 [Kwoniella heveanensis BCC8398]